MPEVNGRFHILTIGDDGPTALDHEELLSEGERYAEIYGSPAIAYGKVYLSTEGWLYALGGKGKAAAPTRKPKKTAVPKGRGDVAYLRIFPADVELEPGARVAFCGPNAFHVPYYAQISFAKGMSWKGEGASRRCVRGRSIPRCGD